MKGVDFPIFKTKEEELNQQFDLNDVEERRKYFDAKAGKEIEKLRDYFQKGKTFIAYLVGVKNSGKGTYSKLFIEAVGGNYVRHLSVGDLVRDVHRQLEGGRKDEFLTFLNGNYRGFHSVGDLENIILGRNTSALIPSELIMAIIKFEISRNPKKALFIDGFPRAQDQISYSLFLKELIGYRDDPDFLVLIDVPEAVINERIKYRVICPQCQTPRNLKLLPTKFVGYDESTKTFYLMCDNAVCNKTRMVQKEGDDLGIEPIRERLETDKKVFKKLFEVQGIPKIYLRNTVPVDKATHFVDEYELTPAYSYKLDKDTGVINTLERPWTVSDDNDVPSYSLLPAAVVVSFIKQTAELLNFVKHASP